MSHLRSLFIYFIFKDRYVIVGNHRDAWVYGSVDPTSGSIVLMEMARIFGQLLKEGMCG